MKKIVLVIVIIFIFAIGIGLYLRGKEHLENSGNDVISMDKANKDYYKVYNSTIAEIMADDVEIERKWLVDVNNIPYDLDNAEIIDIEQTYISFAPEMRVRKLDGGASGYTFTIKTNMTTDGRERDELDMVISEEEYESLVTKKEGNTIYKTRYQFLDDQGYLMAVDIFKGDLEGLAYMEIEFVNTEDSMNYEEPDWVIKEVTHDINYKNGHLARYGIPDDFYTE